jgi:transposase-like protein
MDRALAKVCESCPVCRHARHHQQGVAYNFVKGVETVFCPFCKAYERVHGKKAHEKQR